MGKTEVKHRWRSREQSGKVMREVLMAWARQRKWAVLDSGCMSVGTDHVLVIGDGSWHSIGAQERERVKAGRVVAEG